MKNFLKIFLIVVLTFVFTGCIRKNDTNNNLDSIKFKTEYEALNNNSVVMEIDENNPIKYIEFDEVIDLLNSGTGVLYFGFPGCPWCRNMLPVLFDVAKINNVDTVYYYNPSNIRKNGDDDYKQLTDILNNYLLENEEGVKTLYVPDVYFINNGEIEGHHLSTVDSQTNPFTPLTEEQINELKNIYQELFNKIR